MATISLYASKINQMTGLIQDMKKSVMDYKAELEALKNKTLQINRDACDLEEVISSIQASSRIQDEKIASLEALESNSEQFIEDVVRIDREVSEVINQRQDDFYDVYNYLKPDCEKNGWEKLCSFCKNAGEWCREHWKLVVTIVLVIVAVVVIVCTAGTALGPIAAILAGAAKGLIIGAATGGLIGGISSVAAGGSFWEGFENGAFSGAISGALFGGLGGAGQVFGQAFGSSCNIFTAITYTSRISGTLAIGMIGFDILSLGAGLLFGQDNPLTALNMRLHDSAAYNAFQFGTSALAVFSGSAYQTMKLNNNVIDAGGGSGTIIYGSEDIGNYTYNMIENPGPLAEMSNQPAKNFYGGRYNMEVLQEDRILYRAGNSDNPYGRWFTSEAPASAANVRIDTAVKPHWINPKTGAWEASSYIDNVYAIKVPKGTTIYTGPVGSQGGTYIGGYNIMQTYIDSPWTFEVVGKMPLQ